MFDGDWSRAVSNVMPGVMPGDFEKIAPIGTDSQSASAIKL
jgi:hypothetical protein